MVDDDGARITLDAVYKLLQEVRDKVMALSSLPDVVHDHEARLRELEAHGSSNAQEAERELEKTRLRLHNLEGVTSTLTSAVTENMKSLDATRQTLTWLARLAIGTAFTVLGALIIFLATPK